MILTRIKVSLKMNEWISVCILPNHLTINYYFSSSFVYQSFTCSSCVCVGFQVSSHFTKQTRRWISKFPLGVNVYMVHCEGLTSHPECILGIDFRATATLTKIKPCFCIQFCVSLWQELISKWLILVRDMVDLEENGKHRGNICRDGKSMDWNSTPELRIEPGTWELGGSNAIS